MFRARQVTQAANALANAARHPRAPIARPLNHVLERESARGTASAAAQLVYFTYFHYFSPLLIWTQLQTNECTKPERHRCRCSKPSCVAGGG